MRVLHILEATGGGTARHVVDLCAGLARKGVEVHLAFAPLRMDAIFVEGLFVLREAGCRLLEVPMRRSPHPSDLNVLFTLGGYLRRKGPFDLVHGHSSKGGALARLLRVLSGPVAVYTPHAFVTLASNLSVFGRWVYGMAERSLSPFTSVVIAVSRDEAREAHRLGFPKKKVRLIPNSINLYAQPIGSKKTLRERLGIGPEETVVGFVGRFVPQKAPLVLLEAFAQLAGEFPKARLVMVGEGPLKEHLIKRAQELGIEKQVTWPGFLEGRFAMGAFDLYALSSSYEGFPYVLLEAMAEGLPIVATRVGGTELAIVEGENGFLVEVGDVDGFAQALARLLGDEGLRRRFGEQSLERVQMFKVEKMVEETLNLYRSVVRAEQGDTKA